MSSSRKKKALYPVKVISNSLLKEGVYYLKLEKRFDFTAGQIIAVATNQEDVPRLYSIASGENEDHLALLFDINPTGELTPKLASLKAGNEIYISAPFGDFLCYHTPAMWIATGTGIAPFLSLAKSGKAQNITLLHGSRTLDGFYFQQYFSNILKDAYSRFCTQESQHGVINGRLTTYLKSIKQLPVDYKYYLCGSSQMVIDVREILISKGVAFDSIVAEIYF